MFLTVCLNPTLQKTLRFPSVISGTVNRAVNHRLDVSGKGINVTRVLTQLGKKALHLTQLGGDMRPLFLSLSKSDGLSVEWVESYSEIRFCYTVLNDSNNSVTEMVEESQPVCAETEKRLLLKYEALLDDNLGRFFHRDTEGAEIVEAGRVSQDTLIISGTKAAGFSNSIFPVMVKKAKEKGMRVILDIRGNDLLECLKYEPDIVKPNLYEFASTFMPELIKDNDLAINDSAQLEQRAVKEKIKAAMLETARKYRCRVILTNGSRNILAADCARFGAPDSFFEIEIKPVKAVNTIGCGDAFTAGLAAALADCGGWESREKFKTAINEGIRCGALNAEFVKPGVINFTI